MSAPISQYRRKNLLVDTNILIYQLNGKIDLSTELAAAKNLFVSAISVAELYAGVERNSLLELKNYLAEFTTMPVSEEIATLAGAYKNALPAFSLKDLVIAATAEIHKLTLVTANRHDFQGINSLKPIFIRI